MPISQKQRSGVSASIAHLAEELQYLETKVDPGSLHPIQGVYQNLNSLDTEFWEYQFVIIDLIEDGDEEAFSREQEILDSHDDEIDSLLVCIKVLQSAISQSLPTESQCKRCLLELVSLKKRILSICDSISSLTTEFCLHQHAEMVRG